MAKNRSTFRISRAGLAAKKQYAALAKYKARKIPATLVAGFKRLASLLAVMTECYFIKCPHVLAN